MWKRLYLHTPLSQTHVDYTYIPKYMSFFNNFDIIFYQIDYIIHRRTFEELVAVSKLL